MRLNYLKGEFQLIKIFFKCSHDLHGKNIKKIAKKKERQLKIETFLMHPTRLLLVFVPGRLKVASDPPKKTVLEARMEKLPEVIHRSV
jgi:hypothetical protein